MAENINVFLQSFKNVKKTGANQYICCCPAHYDDKASLSVAYNPSEDKIALHCHAGCDTADILTEVGKTWADVSPTKPEEEKKYTMTFTVSGTMEQLKALKAFMIENNINFTNGGN